MGYGLMVYAVDLEQLRREVGSGDAELAARYGAGFTADDFETQGFIDEHIPGAPGTLTLVDVARQVIMGEPYDERVGFAYGYFLKWLCEQHGTSQWNGSLMPIPVDLSTLDAEFGRAGLRTPEISIHELGWGGAPVPVPMGDPWPGIGYLEHQHLGAAAELLAGAPNSDLPEEFHGAAYDIFQMLSHAHADNRSLVGFFH